jgi:hypothetical protein
MERQSTGEAGVMHQNRRDLDQAGVFAVGAVAEATARTVVLDQTGSVPDVQRGLDSLDLTILLAAAAGIAHAISVPVHLRWWLASGVFFIAMALAQLGLAGALLVQRTSPRVVLAGIVSNVVVVCVYVASRLVALPGQPVFTGSHHGALTPGRPFLPPAPEGVGPFDLFALVVELALIAMLAGMLPARTRSRAATVLMFVGVGMCLVDGWTLLVRHASG